MEYFNNRARLITRYFAPGMSAGRYAATIDKSMNGAPSRRGERTGLSVKISRSFPVSVARTRRIATKRSLTRPSRPLPPPPPPSFPRFP